MSCRLWLNIGFYIRLQMNFTHRGCKEPLHKRLQTHAEKGIMGNKVPGVRRRSWLILGLHLHHFKVNSWAAEGSFSQRGGGAVMLNWGGSDDSPHSEQLEDVMFVIRAECLTLCSAPSLEPPPAEARFEGKVQHLQNTSKHFNHSLFISLAAHFCLCFAFSRADGSSCLCCQRY